MKIALQTYSLHLAFGRHADGQHHRQRLSLEQCLYKAKAWGFAGVQIDPMHLDESSQTYAAHVRNIADRENLFLELGVMGFNRTHVLQQLALAEWLGTRFIRIFEVVGPRPKDPNQIQEKLELISREVEAILPTMEKTGITLGWENHVDYTTSEQLIVLQRLNHPQFRACIDLGNSMAFLEPPLETVQRLAPFAGGVHFKDYALQGTTFGFKYYGVALGSGVIPLKEILKVLESETEVKHVVYEQSIDPISSDAEEAVRFEELTLLQSLQYAFQELKMNRQVGDHEPS
jgi:3-oxoisoapionate decarboxylase